MFGINSVKQSIICEELVVDVVATKVLQSIHRSNQGHSPTMAAFDVLTLLATVSEENISYTKQGGPSIFYDDDILVC